MKRTAIIVVSMLFLAFFLVACANGAVDSAAAGANTTSVPAASGTAASDTATADAAANGTLELTLDQLKQYDGKNGNPAYVAVDGVIYDVTNVKAWKNGDHNGYSAGNDLTDIIKNKSPHGVKNLEGLPIVGKLIDG
ncbi:MAG: cytochrome b5 domain-containing protein [Christensenella sp.]|nr:cytochrome b5 domain-containing protein [Christensenella sp.]